VKHQEDFIHAAAATTLVTIAQVQTFIVQLFSTLVIACLSAVMTHFVRRWLRAREWSKKAKELHARIDKHNS
jgi:CHASE1-domain containing sensor protein